MRGVWTAPLLVALLSVFRLFGYLTGPSVSDAEIHRVEGEPRRVERGRDAGDTHRGHLEHRARRAVRRRPFRTGAARCRRDPAAGGRSLLHPQRLARRGPRPCDGARHELGVGRRVPGGRGVAGRAALTGQCCPEPHADRGCPGDAVRGPGRVALVMGPRCNRGAEAASRCRARTAGTGRAQRPPSTAAAATCSGQAGRRGDARRRRRAGPHHSC